MKWIIVYLFVLVSLKADEIVSSNISATLNSNGSMDIVESFVYKFEHDESPIVLNYPRYFKSKFTQKPVYLNPTIYEVTIDEIPSDYNIQKDSKNRYLKLQIESPFQSYHKIHSYTIKYHIPLSIFPSQDNDKDEIRFWNFVTSAKVPIYYLSVYINSKETMPYIYSSTIDFTLFGSNRVYGYIYNPKNNLDIALTTDIGAFGIKGIDFIAEQTLEDSIKLSKKQNIKEILPVRLIVAEFFVLIMVLLIIYYNSKNMPKRIHKKQDTPPEGINALKASFIYYKELYYIALAGAIIELGYKGYLEIFDDENMITPLIKRIKKDTSNLSKDELFILNSFLFDKGNTFVLNEANSANEYVDRVSKFKNLKEIIYNWAKKSDIVSNSIQRWRVLFIIPLYTIVGVLGSISIGYSYNVMDNNSAFFAFIIAISIALIGYSQIKLLSKYEFVGRFRKYIYIIIALLTLNLIHSLGNNPLILFATPIPVALLFCLIFYADRQLGRFTQKGIRVYKEVIQFREYLSATKCNRYTRVYKENWETLYRYSPYAISLKAKNWLKLYYFCGVEIPKWYHGDRESFAMFHTTLEAVFTPYSEEESIIEIEK